MGHGFAEFSCGQQECTEIIQVIGVSGVFMVGLLQVFARQVMALQLVIQTAQCVQYRRAFRGFLQVLLVTLGSVLQVTCLLRCRCLFQ